MGKCGVSSMPKRRVIAPLARSAMDHYAAPEAIVLISGSASSELGLDND